MEVDVTTFEEYPPKQSVLLELSPAEFAVLYLLHREGNGGDPCGLRGRVEAGLESVFNDLHEEYQRLIESSHRDTAGTGYPADRVSCAFKLA